MKVKQLSVFLENKPGALRRPIKMLADKGYNILTLSLADTQQFGILRLLVREWEKAGQLLQKEGFVVKVSEVVAIEVPDKPGELAEILSVLEKEKINVEYLYGFTLKAQGKGLLAFRFDDPDRAIASLQKQKINPVRIVQLFEALES
jgi:hypothetical protein